MGSTLGIANGGELPRRAYRLSELPADVAEAIEASTMNPAHDQLNELLKEQK